MEDKRKNVLVIAPSLSKRLGAGRMSREIVLRLQHEVNLRVLTETWEGENECNAEQVLEKRTSFLGFVRNCMRVRQAAKGVSIVHAFDAYPYGVYGYCAVVGTKRKLFINGVGTYSAAPLLNPKTHFVTALACRRAIEILCISSYTKKRMDEALFGLSTTVMHLGTTKLPVPTKEMVASVRERLAIPKDAFPVIVTVGEIKERKGQLDTLMGLVLLKEQFPNSLYIMVGSDTDEYVEVIRDYAEKNGQAIRITSELKSDSDLASAYVSADIFALNSNNHEMHFEGFGLVVLEAAQFGVPAIGSKGCGIEDAIQDGVSGILLGQMDHVGIAEAIRTILLSQNVFKAGALAWYTRFPWEKTISIILKAYER